MTREILFRGFHKDENGKETIYLNGKEIKGEWVYGYLIKGATRYVIQESIAQYPQYEVIPETVGQYLNKQDKNDKNIFEKDLLRGCEDMYDDEVMGTPILSLENGLQLHCKNKIYHFDYIYDEEVIGTIFDKEVK